MVLLAAARHRHQPTALVTPDRSRSGSVRAALAGLPLLLLIH